MVGAESRPSPTVILSEAPHGGRGRALGACGRRAVEGPLTSSVGGPAGRKKRESFDCAPPAHPTPPPQATRRSAQDTGFLFRCGAARLDATENYFFFLTTTYCLLSRIPDLPLQPGRLPLRFSIGRPFAIPGRRCPVSVSHASLRIRPRLRTFAAKSFPAALEAHSLASSF